MTDTPTPERQVPGGQPGAQSADLRSETPEVRLQPGDAFPPYALPDAEGALHTPAGAAGRYLVVYVYPKDDTPGCTAEACDFRDSAELRGLGARIVGISRDDAGSHAAFAEKHALPFPLLSDPDAAYLRSIGAYGRKVQYGKVSEGVRRSTFLVGPDGRLVRAWYAVKVDGHADAVARAIRADQAGNRVP